jgi:hypothetical protein
VEVTTKFRVFSDFGFLAHEKHTQAGVVSDRVSLEAGSERDRHIGPIVLMTVVINCGVILAPIMSNETLEPN